MSKKLTDNNSRKTRLSERIIVWMLLSVGLFLFVATFFINQNVKEHDVEVKKALVESLLNEWIQRSALNADPAELALELENRVKGLSFVLNVSGHEKGSDHKAVKERTVVIALLPDRKLEITFKKETFETMAGLKSWQVLVLLGLFFALITILVFLSRRFDLDLNSMINALRSIKSGKSHSNVFTKSSFQELSNIEQLISELTENFIEKPGQAAGRFERFIRVLEFSPVLVISLSNDLVISYANKQFKNYLPEKYQESQIFSLLPENVQQFVDQCMLENKVVQGVEVVINEKNLVWSFVPMPELGEVCCFGTDITAFRLAESKVETAYVDSMKAQDESRAKSMFLANISHEIRTPLTAILGFSESLLESDQKMEERVASINTIIRNATDLLSIINDLLDITKIESGQIFADIHAVSVVDIVNDVCRVMIARTEKKGLSFNSNIEYPIPEKILSDDLRVKQILFNICDNAVKFTEQGGIKLSVSYSDENSELVFVISDTGKGIEEDQQRAIFEMFKQLDEGHARLYGGVGLGLYICSQIIEHLGGSISVQSNQNGSQFTVRINARVAEGSDIVRSDAEQKMVDVFVRPEHKQFKGKVLIVEDNIDNQNLIKMYLKKMGVEVGLANNGEEAVDKVKDENFDLILMDMQMPVMDGVESTRKIMAYNKESTVVMLTANVMEDDVETCREAGCQEILTKPIKRSDFEKVIGGYLEIADQENMKLEPVVSDLVNEGPEFFNIVKAYVKQIPGDLDSANKAFGNDDFGAFKRKVHSMKGTSGNMGFIEFSQICAKVEFAITKGDDEEIARLLASLKEMKHRIEAGIE